MVSVRSDRVALAEEGQGEFAQALGQTDSLFAALAIGLAICIVVLEPMRYPKHNGEDDEADQIGHDVRQRRPDCQRFDKLLHKQEEEPDTEHRHEVHHDRPESTEPDVLRTRIRERVLLFHALHRAPPSATTVSS